MIKLNLNSLLVILGGLGVFAPDVTVIATWLDGLGVHWLSYVAKGLGFVAVFFAAAPLAVPKLRAFLALVGLATPAGSVVPSPTQPASAEPSVPDSNLKPASGQPAIPDSTPTPEKGAIAMFFETAGYRAGERARRSGEATATNSPLPPASNQPVVTKEPRPTSASKSDGVSFKRYTVTLKRSDGIMERQGISVFRSNWSEDNVLTRLRSDGYPIGASAKLQGWPSDRFEVRSLKGILVMEDRDPREASNWGGSSDGN
jgi:hypothetical protein